MTVLGAHAVCLEVPNLDDGIRFYKNAGLEVRREKDIAYFRCPGQTRDSITLIAGAKRKRIHHIALRADGTLFGATRDKIVAHGGKIVSAPNAFDADGIWLTDPHGMTVHLVDAPADAPLEPAQPFTINEPGRTPRVRQSAMLSRANTKPTAPLRLGHILVFSPDVPKSVEFFTEALGMGLADRAQDIIAFCCARKNSDHHVVAFAKSPGVGFHHASFQVADPDAVGRGGAQLLESSGRGGWGFGRHTIGSNFFHYIQDPWGSWFEYYSDLDYIDDYSLWTPTNYEMQDSLSNWGPPVPADFVHNYEIDGQPFVGTTTA
jgi:catechol 2,3-dioxygenase-like lactoylglutathione lyase family enzyme